jgi:hypothetical protein
MAELHLKREKEPVWFPDNKFDQVNEIYKDFVENGTDAIIELPNNTTTASQIVKIKRKAIEKEDVTKEVTEEDFEGFCVKIEPFTIDKQLEHWQYMNFLATSNVISLRDKDGNLVKKATSKEHYGTLMFALIEGNINFYQWYDQLHDKYQYKYGRRDIIAQKEKEHLSEKSGVVSEALKIKNDENTTTTPFKEEDN